MGFEYGKLKGRIVEKYGTRGKFAEAAGISEVTVSKKLNEKTQFSQEDIVLWCRLLDIPILEAGSYFFA